MMGTLSLKKLTGCCGKESKVNTPPPKKKRRKKNHRKPTTKLLSHIFLKFLGLAHSQPLIDRFFFPQINKRMTKPKNTCTNLSWCSLVIYGPFTELVNSFVNCSVGNSPGF